MMQQNTLPTASTSLAENYCKIGIRANVELRLGMGLGLKVRVSINAVICCRCGRYCRCDVLSHTLKIPDFHVTYLKTITQTFTAGADAAVGLLADAK